MKKTFDVTKAKLSFLGFYTNLDSQIYHFCKYSSCQNAL